MHTNSWDELLELDRRAVRASVAALAGAGPGDLGRPTPCASWTLADLLAHMTVQQDGFAEAADGAVTDVARWAPVQLGESAIEAYRAASERVVAAFARPGVGERRFSLPEIRDGGFFPAAQAVAFHLVDNVVHAWDAAVTLGRQPDLDAEVVGAVLAVVQVIPDGPERLAPGAAFAPGLDVPDGTADLDRVLLLLGRSPDWDAAEGVSR